MPPELIGSMTVPLTGTVRDALRAIDRTGMGVALLVDDNGKFIGLVTDGDLRRALLAGHGLDYPLKSVDHPTSVTAKISDTPEVVAKLFNERVHIIPLLDADGRIADIAQMDRRVRLPVAEPVLGDKELQYVTESVVSGWVSSTGPFVARFEDAFAKFCGTKHAIAMSNGTTALHATLLALGIGPGDEVIVPSFTFIASANAVKFTGATPVLVDSEQETWNIDPKAAEAAITEKTKAIMPVHVYGHPANMDPILALGKKHGLAIIEDAAEAHGALYRGKPVGSLGHVGIFSFYGNKIVTTGEGGMIVTNDDDLAKKTRMLRDHGMSTEKRYWHTVLGYNYRLTSLQAALGVAQMERIDDILERKTRIASWYGEGLKGIAGITLPPAASWAKNVYWLYSIMIDEKAFGLSRDALMQHLQEKGIDSRPFFPPVHIQPIYQTGQKLPVSEWLGENGISLPSGAHLKKDDIHRVCEEIRALERQQGGQ